MRTDSSLVGDSSQSIVSKDAAALDKVQKLALFSKAKRMENLTRKLLMKKLALLGN